MEGLTTPRITFQQLARRLVKAIRAEAAKIPDFDNGAIRLSFIPICDKAVNFFGGFDLECRIDLGFPIKEGGHYTRPARFLGEEYQEERGCYGYAALKIEGCDYALNHCLGQRSCDMPQKGKALGRVNDRGCVVYDIFTAEKFGIADTSPDEHYFRLYVSVDGSNDYRKDELCALAASGAIQQWCDTELNDDGYGHYEKYLSFIGPKQE